MKNEKTLELIKEYNNNAEQMNKAFGTDKYRSLVEKSIKLSDNLVNIYGEENFRVFNLADKNQQLTALLTGKVNQGIKTFKNKKGCYGIEK